MLKETKSSQKRAGPRAKAAIQVEVEVAGEKRKVKLLSRDIGTGGVFLRTTNPAPLWKRVRMVLESPEGKPLEITGEVVRSIPPEKARQTKYPPGMAIAFDEASRAKRKQLVELVLELCARQQDEDNKPVASGPQQTPPKSGASRDENGAKPDSVLQEIDSLLVDLEQETSGQNDAQAQGSEDEELELNLPEDDAEKPDLTQESTEKGGQGDSNAAVVEEANVLRQRLQSYRSSLGGDTHYHVLGLGLDATADQIENGYRKLIKELTPGVPPDRLPADLQQQLKAVLNRIRKAYAILSKPERKRAYDFLLDNLVEDQL